MWRWLVAGVVAVLGLGWLFDEPDPDDTTRGVKWLEENEQDHYRGA